MITSLLPAGAVPYEESSDIPGELPFPGEESLIARAVEGRRCEFITARRCGRRALGRLGYPPAPILSGSRRGPPLAEMTGRFAVGRGLVVTAVTVNRWHRGSRPVRFVPTKSILEC